MGEIWRKAIATRLISVLRADDLRREVDNEIYIEWLLVDRYRNILRYRMLVWVMINRQDNLIIALCVYNVAPLFRGAIRNCDRIQFTTACNEGLRGHFAHACPILVAWSATPVINLVMGFIEYHNLNVQIDTY